LKNGFSTDTQNATLYGGSYGREAGILEFGRRFGSFALYVVGDATHDDGFRQTGTTNLRRLYTDLGWRDQEAEVHLGLTAARNILGNPGAAPEQALAAGISNIFTAPNSVDNNFFGANLNGTYKLSDSLALQGLGYYQKLNQVVPNGITSQVAGCADGSGLLCNSDGTVVTTFNGTPVTDFENGGLYSGLSVQQLNTHAYGVSAQLSDSATLAGRGNHFVGGLSFDGSDSLFAGKQELGGFDPYSRQFLGPGVVQDQPAEGVLPVRVRSTTRFYGVFATETFHVIPRFEVNVAGRFNDAQVNLEDELGGPVNGRHTFTRFNPSAGLTYRVSNLMQLYASYSETNRAPTPQELSCASAAAPCTLLNFFVGDPDLRQVVARTVEAGLRGHAAAPRDLELSWNVDAYRTNNRDDIIYESTVYNPNLAFYTNAGRTRRQGIESNLRVDTRQWHVSVGYAFTDATFQTGLVLNSPDNPGADANGQQQVVPGNRIPGIPKHRATLVVDYNLTHGFSVGGSVVTQSNAYRFGDEANLTAPLAGYTVLDLNAAFHAGDRFTVFAVVNNVLGRRYDTYGTFGPVGDVPWPNIPGGVTDSRTASPGAPLTAYGGVRTSF
jgi:outer membrane receptor protein involved in Fe transport